MSAFKEYELPHLVATVHLDDKLNNADSFGYQNCPAFFAVKFYPYVMPGIDPFFAVTGGSDTLICRPSKGKAKAVEVIRWFKDEDNMAQLNSCAWTKDLETGHPLICVAGSSAAIKILDVVTGKLVKTLVGHGKDIGDLSVSPTSPQVLASASEDQSIRLWSLNKRHSKQPCAVILAGEGHKENILTIAFHSTGRYLLSGGIDCIINLWVLPSPLPDPRTVGTDSPTLLNYPHFSTSAIHSDYVDCVTFHHDLILSKCAREGKIVLWRIDGFSSSNPHHFHGKQAPTTHEMQDTRSAFGNGYQRLIQFKMPLTDPFYMRFGFFDSPGKHPVLAMGNVHSKILLWDLQQLESRSLVDDPDLLKFLRRRGGGKGRGSRHGRGRGGEAGSKKRTSVSHSQVSASRSSRSASSSLAPPPQPPTSSGPFPGVSNNSNNNNNDASNHPTPTPTPTPTPSQLLKAPLGPPPAPSSSTASASEPRSSSVVDEPTPASTASDIAWNKRHNISDPFGEIHAHREITIPKIDFATRQIAWSTGGEWMVAVGDYRVIALFRRWDGTEDEG